MSAPPDKIYEYIVIGTGITGVQAVETLLDAGREVLVVDVAYQSDSKQQFPDTDFISLRTHSTDQCKLFLGENYEGIHWERIKTGAQLTPGRKHIVKGIGIWLSMVSDTFFPYESLAYGGLGNAWGGGCYMFSDIESERMGLVRTALLPHYQRAADRVGVTQADADGAAYSVAGLTGLLPALQPEQSIQKIYDRYQDKRQKFNRDGFYLSRPSVAVTTEARGERAAFQYRDMEFWQDNDKSVYRPWIAFNQLLKQSNITTAFGKIVTHYQELSDHTIVYTIDVTTGEEMPYKCRKLLLCCGVLSTARIVLRSYDSDRQLPLLCNPYAYVPMLHWRWLGKATEQYKNGMGQLVMYYDPQHNNSDVSMAALFTYRSLLLFRLIKETPLNYADGRLLQQYLAPALVIAGIHHSEQSGTDKWVSLQRDAESVTGYSLHATYRLGEADLANVKQKEQSFFRAFRSLGCIPLSKLDPGMGASIHYAGCLPFSDTEHPFTTAMDGRLHGTKSIFIADGSAFKYLPAKGISFTLMANADRVATESLKYSV